MCNYLIFIAVFTVIENKFHIQVRPCVILVLFYFTMHTACVKRMIYFAWIARTKMQQNDFLILSILDFFHFCAIHQAQPEKCIKCNQWIMKENYDNFSVFSIIAIHYWEKKILSFIPLFNQLIMQQDLQVKSFR